MRKPTILAGKTIYVKILMLFDVIFSAISTIFEPMTIAELYSLYLDHPVISTDSRNIPQGSLFFALKGESFNGNLFAESALKKGAAYAIVDEKEYVVSDKCILVDDSLKALQQLARHHRLQLNIPFLAITGTNGKTTTKELIHAVLSQRFKTLATKGNLNNHIGVPLTILSISGGIELAIIEMGANHQGEIRELCEIALPTHGLISNVGKAHLEGFGSFEGVKKTKGEMYDFLKANKGTIFINGGNENLREMLGSGYGNTVTYGASPVSVVQGDIVENDPFISVSWNNQGNLYKVRTQLTGSYNLENILASITIGLHFGVDAMQINTGLAAYAPGNNRSQIIRTANNLLVCDYYNANPSSMSVAIDNLRAISSEKKVFIAGDMFELGETSAAEHLLVIEKATQGRFSQCIFIGEAFYSLLEQGKGLFFKTTVEALEYLKENQIKGATVLVKGSRSMKLEILIPTL